MKRKCAICGKMEPEAEFYKVGTYCKPCKCAYQRERNLYLRYEMNPEEYTNLLEAQGGGCALCGKTPEEERRRLAVDHTQGQEEFSVVVRGLLCTACNVRLGHLEYFLKNTDALDAAKKYLQVS
ncbi:MAG: endonuclease domain-containing protein [Nitrosopumilus sp.]